MLVRKIFFLFLLLPLLVEAQNDSTFLDLSGYVVLDSIMITAKRGGFDVKEFMLLAQNDETLETAFKNLRKISYTYQNEIQFFSPKNKVEAAYKSQIRQIKDPACQWMRIEKEEHSGDYFRKSGEYNYYTSKLYDRIFFVRKSPCDAVAKTAKPRNPSRVQRIMDARVEELKKLIYRAGKKADIPLIGNQTAIFDEKMLPYYDFFIDSRIHSSGAETYVFTARVKPFLNHEEPEATVVKYLEIYFKKSDFQVLERNTKLKYDAGIYQFDILMTVSLDKHKDLYVPSKIGYDGYWKIVGKARENCRFTFDIIDIE